MNYYERHLGDYVKDTAHLTMLEQGAYNLLLDRYYGTEVGIPADQVYRVTRASTKQEKAAVNSVLKEFFKLNNGTWVKDRCEHEIERFKEKSAKARHSAMLGVEARRTKSNADIRSDRMAAAKTKGRHTKEEWLALVEFCGGRCVRCGASGHLDRDHIIPVYQGGSDGIDNIQPLCARCNASKGPEDIDHRPTGWQAFVERSLSVRSALQSPVSSLHTKEKNQSAQKGLSENRKPELDRLIRKTAQGMKTKESL